MLADFRPRFAVASLLGVCAGASAGSAWADDVDGRFSYALELRGNGFQQRSSRVVVPEVELAITAPDGLRLAGSYLVDVITSASVAQGGGDSGDTFTELRHGGELGLERELGTGDTPLSLRVRVGLSVEDDYTSVRVVEGQSLALDERNLVLSLDLGASRDAVRSNLEPAFHESLTGLLLRASIERVLHPRVVVVAGYDLAWLHGFQANPYRRVLVGPLPYPERHPSERLRHEVSLRVKAAVAGTETGLQLGAHAYADSWDIAAIAPELRVYQPLGATFVVQAHYRFYAQTAAYFFRQSYFEATAEFVTNDPKMTALRTHTFGGSVEVELPWLTSARGGYASEATIDLALDRYLSTSAYGDGWLATGGCRMSF